MVCKQLGFASRSDYGGKLMGVVGITKSMVNGKVMNIIKQQIEAISIIKQQHLCQLPLLFRLTLVVQFCFVFFPFCFTPRLLFGNNTQCLVAVHTCFLLHYNFSCFVYGYKVIQ